MNFVVEKSIINTIGDHTTEEKSSIRVMDYELPSSLATLNFITSFFNLLEQNTVKHREG